MAVRYNIAGDTMYRNTNYRGMRSYGTPEYRKITSRRIEIAAAVRERALWFRNYIVPSRSATSTAMQKGCSKLFIVHPMRFFESLARSSERSGGLLARARLLATFLRAQTHECTKAGRRARERERKSRRESVELNSGGKRGKEATRTL